MNSRKLYAGVTRRGARLDLAAISRLRLDLACELRGVADVRAGCQGEQPVRVRVRVRVGVRVGVGVGVRVRVRVRVRVN